MSSFFLGIDPSATGTGLSIVDSTGKCQRVLLIKPAKLRDCARLAAIHEAINSFVNGTPISLCVMETPAYGAVHKEFILGEVLGAIKLTLTLLGIPVKGAAPTQLKKFLCGSGTASKSDMVEQANLTGCSSDIEDICDSWSAALVALGIGHSLPSNLVTRARLEVIKQITQV